MRHELRVTLEWRDLAALNRGLGIELTIGDTVMVLAADRNGMRPTSGRNAANVCSYCKRDLSTRKHSQGCRVLAQESARKRYTKRKAS